MKRLAMVLAVVAMGACSKPEQKAAAQGQTMQDTSHMMMMSDTSKMMADTAKHMMAPDTSNKMAPAKAPAQKPAAKTRDARQPSSAHAVSHADDRHQAAAHDADDPRREQAVALAVDDVRPERHGGEAALGLLPHDRFGQPLAAGVEVVLGDRPKRKVLGAPLGLRPVVGEAAVHGDGGDVHEPRATAAHRARGEPRPADVER